MEMQGGCHWPSCHSALASLLYQQADRKGKTWAFTNTDKRCFSPCNLSARGESTMNYKHLIVLFSLLQLLITNFESYHFFNTFSFFIYRNVQTFIGRNYHFRGFKGSWVADSNSLLSILEGSRNCMMVLASCSGCCFLLYFNYMGLSCDQNLATTEHPRAIFHLFREKHLTDQ